MSTQITNLRELALEVGELVEEGAHYYAKGIDGEYYDAKMGPDAAIEATKKAVSRRLYKATSCGIGIHFAPDGVSLVGYCEGFDGEIEPHWLAYPFTAEQFWAEVEAANEDGCRVWNETHGCPVCIGLKPDDYAGYDEALEASQSYGQWGIEVNPDCTECDGHGMVI